MQIISADPRVDSVWQELVERRDSSVFHSPAWHRVLADTYGLDVGAYVVLGDGGEPQAGISFCRIADAIGRRTASLPFSDYCDPLVSDQQQWDPLIQRLTAEGAPLTLRCLHNSLPLGDERLALVKQARWHGLDLRSELDSLWQRLHPSCRRAIAKARREGVVVRFAQHKEELRAFFDLHLRVRKYKYHMLAQPCRFFEHIWDQFIEPGRGVLLTAVYRDQIIGGVMFLAWKGTLYYKFNASAPDDLPHRPNDLLIWEGIQYAKANGHVAMDFGLSDWDQEGLIRYKRKFATDEKAISFLRYTPSGAVPPQEREARQLLSQLTDLLTHESVPDSITDRAGEVLYRLFS